MGNSIVIKGAGEHNLKSGNALNANRCSRWHHEPNESTISGLGRFILMLKRVM